MSSQKNRREILEALERILNTAPQALHRTRFARPAFSSITAMMPPVRNAMILNDPPILTAGLCPANAPQFGQASWEMTGGSGWISFKALRFLPVPWSCQGESGFDAE